MKFTSRLTDKDENGVLDANIQWNFQKFLIDENGNMVGTLSPGIGKEILLLQKWFTKD
jgi:glutathione peroxidase